MSNEEIKSNITSEKGKGIFESVKEAAEVVQDKVERIGDNMSRAAIKAEEEANKIKSATVENVENISESAAKGLKFESIGDAKDKITSGFKNFTSGFKLPSAVTGSTIVGATNSFMNSNSLIS